MTDTCGMCSTFSLAMTEPEVPASEPQKPDVICNMDAVNTEGVPTIRPTSPGLLSIPESEDEGKLGDGIDSQSNTEQKVLQSEEKPAEAGAGDEEDEEKATAVDSLVVCVKVEGSHDVNDENILDVKEEIASPSRTRAAGATDLPEETEQLLPKHPTDKSPTASIACCATPEEEEEPVEVLMERDFDKNPTELYSSLQKKEWDEAIGHIETSPLDTRVWIYRKETDGNLRWRLLPIHAAIIFNAPQKVVDSLLNVYPEGAGKRDDQGMLPLHLSFRMGSSEETVSSLLDAFPDSVNAKDRKGRTALALAESSTAPNKESFLRVIRRDIRKRLIAASSIDFSESPSVDHALSTVEETSKEESLEKKTSQLKATIEKNNSTSQVLAVEEMSKEESLEKEVSQLKETIEKNNSTSQVLVGHIASLEAQLTKQKENDSFISQKLAALDASLQGKSSEEVETISNETFAQLHLRIKELELENSSVQDQKKTFEDQKKTWAEEKAKSEEQISILEADCGNLRSDVVVLEEQIKMRTETEKSLAAQVATLANQLLSASDESGNCTAAFTQRIRSLEKERENLRFSVDKLSKKLYLVASMLDSMGKQQAGIVEEALANESQAAMAACAQADILQQVKEQAEAVEKAKEDRERIMQLLNEHVSQLENAKEARVSVLEAVEEQAQGLATSSEHRLAFIKGVTGLKDKMGEVLDSVFLDVPKDVPEDDKLVDQVLEIIMSQSESSQDPKESKTFSGEMASAPESTHPEIPEHSKLQDKLAQAETPLNGSDPLEAEEKKEEFDN